MAVGDRVFRDRLDAGRRLAVALGSFDGEDVVVLGLPRGGVPVAAEVARALHAPLDVIVVRKLGLPFQPELAMGAIGEDGVRVLNEEVIRLADVGPDEIAALEQVARRELERRVARYRGDRLRVPLTGRIAIVVDDGIATGATARAACLIAKASGARRVVLAVPVAPPSARDELGDVCDELVLLETPEAFLAVGQWYGDFSQVSDSEVGALLRKSAPAREVLSTASSPADPPVRDADVEVAIGPLRLEGHLVIPEDPRGIVVFAHGSGSSRHSPRNRFVSEALNAAGFGTLLFDLLTADEELDRRSVFDVELLAGRLEGATAWLGSQTEARGARLGYFGASTGAAAALVAAAHLGNDVGAVVSRGGRPDLAGSWLGAVRAPTLLIVGGHDDAVIALNRKAQDQLSCETRLEVVPGATHLFEEEGALEQVTDLASVWFANHLARGTAHGS